MESRNKTKRGEGETNLKKGFARWLSVNNARRKKSLWERATRPKGRGGRRVTYFKTEKTDMVLQPVTNN